jgi:DNA-binding CsgD family transcriptional regulator
VHVTIRRFAEGERYLRAGVAYSAERDLDSWRLYMSGWLARSMLEQGDVVAAEECASDVLRHPHLSPVTHFVASLVVGQLAVRRGDDGSEQLDGALALARRIGEAQRLMPVAAVRAEAAWISGGSDGIIAEIDQAWPTAIAHPQRWELGELSWWLAVAGVRRESPVEVPRPFALMLEGAAREAAAEWDALGCPLWKALALAMSPDVEDGRSAVEIADAVGAPAVRQAILRDRRRRGLPVPRGPRSATQANAWGLTARELDVLRLLADGLSNAEVAERLFLSDKTVGHHVSSVLRKLGEPTRSRAVASALRQGIVTPG